MFTEDHELRSMELQIAKEITLDKKRFEQQRRKDEEALILQKRKLDLQERKAQIDTLNTLLELVFKKL